MASEASVICPDPTLILSIERLAAVARAEGMDGVDELLADVLALLHGWPAARPAVLKRRRPAVALRLLPGGRA